MMKGQLRINQIFAFIVLDDDGIEGVPAVGYNGMLLPLMGADMARIDSLKAIVQRDPALKGKKIILARFGHRENIGTIDRTGEGDE
jgi:hypothetical protein